jgi:hypothetical protein
VEILSPSTSRHDRVRKLALYARYGVPEYWIVSPEPAMLEVLTLAGDCYRLRGFMPVDEVRSSTIPELKLRLAVGTLPTRGRCPGPSLLRLVPPESREGWRIALPHHAQRSRRATLSGDRSIFTFGGRSQRPRPECVVTVRFSPPERLTD